MRSQGGRCGSDPVCTGQWYEYSCCIQYIMYNTIEDGRPLSFNVTVWLAADRGDTRYCMVARESVTALLFECMDFISTVIKVANSVRHQARLRTIVQARREAI